MAHTWKKLSAFRIFKKKYIYKHSRRLAFLIFFLFIPTLLMAQEPYETHIIHDPLAQLMTRVAALETDNRELRGLLEETQHQLSTLQKQMNSLHAEIEYRLNATESDAMPLPLSSSISSMTDENKSPSPSFNLQASSSKEDYERALTILEQGDYEAAERAFASFVNSYPKDKLAGAAQYWLGVTYFVRGTYEKAAAAFAKGYKNYPKSQKAAANLLKLAQSLAALDRIADACTTLEQLSSEHPQAHANEVASERKKLNCK